ncbi:BrnT family toxin [Halovibrio sp. HP20-50]|uniref:BrnT family toxin n=1 Tax=Halovibrio sp. HP20-59 TaxID=3080275 RepID=UPI00294B1FFD|nr:BrnT family toxin [Halovibrio sp. HP20-59]MEA2120255.1 BrnT family toxin [Halovibrio sp. HP20-59]
MSDFEYDDDKSAANRIKHGINFLEAQALWNDPDLLEIQAKSDDEPRFLIVVLIGDKHWSAVITYRNERIRLISVRRSRKREVELYES